MPFRWVADASAEAEGIVFAVDVSQRAHGVGFEGSTFVSRGVWARFVGAGAGQGDRLLETLSAASAQMTSPSRASADGTAALFDLRTRAASERVVSLVDPDRASATFMLWQEFVRRPAHGSLRVRVVAEEDEHPGA